MANPNLDQMTKAELVKLARKQKITVRPTMLKNEIVAALKKRMKQSVKPTKKQAAKITKQKTKAAAKKTTSRSAAKSKRKAIRSSKPAKATASARALSSGNLVPGFQLEDLSQEAKFIVAPTQVRDESHFEISAELPADYGDHKLVMMVRDPYWVHLYWELQGERIESALQSVSQSIEEVRCILRITPTSGGDIFDVDTDFRTGNQYLQLSPPGASFYVEIGFLTREGRFEALARSNTITLPLDRPSEVIDERWMTSEEEFQRIYQLSGGSSQRGLDSAEALAARGESVDFASWEAGSFSSPGFTSETEEQAPFELEAELILYGKTEPGNRLTLAGDPVTVRSDGSFSTRMALPDGEHTLPMTLETADGEKSYSLTPVITRKTRPSSKEDN